MNYFQLSFGIFSKKAKSGDKFQPLELYLTKVEKVLPSCEVSKHMPDPNIEYCLEQFFDANKNIFQGLQNISITSTEGAMKIFDKNCADCKLCVETKKTVAHNIPLDDFFEECRTSLFTQTSVYLVKVLHGIKPGKSSK